jgi:hypothetical protein
MPTETSKFPEQRVGILVDIQNMYYSGKVLYKKKVNFKEVLKAGETYLGPAAGTGLVVFALVILVLGRRAALAAGSLAIVAGFAVANYLYPQPVKLFPWWPQGKGWHWLPLLFLLAQFDGLFARVPTVPIWGGWRLRLVLGFIAALVIVPADLHKSWPLLVNAFPYPFAARAWALIAFTLFVAARLGRFGDRGGLAGGRGTWLSFAMFGVARHLARAMGIIAEAITFPRPLFGISIGIDSQVRHRRRCRESH